MSHKIKEDKQGHVQAPATQAKSSKMRLVKMAQSHLALWQAWSEKPHVKDVWFIEGYEPPEYMAEKIKGNGYDFPHIVYLDDKLIGYVVYCDLHAYRSICPQPKGLFTQEAPGTYCVDLFIGEEDWLNQGYGTKIMRLVLAKLFNQLGAHKVLIDPAITNTRAIRCYEKCGFQPVRQAHDGVSACLVLEVTPSTFIA